MCLGPDQLPADCAAKDAQDDECDVGAGMEWREEWETPTPWAMAAITVVPNAPTRRHPQRPREMQLLW